MMRPTFVITKMVEDKIKTSMANLHVDRSNVPRVCEVSAAVVNWCDLNVVHCDRIVTIIIFVIVIVVIIIIRPNATA